MKPVLLLMLCACCGWAQTDNNAHGWYMYFGDHAFGKSKSGAHLEGQWRRAGLAPRGSNYSCVRR